MKRRAWGWVFVANLVAFGLATYLPALRLEAELAAARREGAPTNPEEVRALFGPKRREDNGAWLAARAMENEFRAQARAGFRAVQTNGIAVSRVIQGRARPGDRKIVADWLDRDPLLLEDWREVARQPHVAFLMDEYPITIPEYRPVFTSLAGSHGMRLGQTRLLAAAAMGRSPRENVLCAARLVGKTKEDVGLVAPCLAYNRLPATFHLARREGVASQVRAALGPPPDIRRALAIWLPEQLRSMEKVRHRSAQTFDGRTWMERLRQTALLSTVAKIQVVRAWRDLWRELPVNPHDYAAATVVVDRHVPRLTRLLKGYSSRLDTPYLGLTEFHSGLDWYVHNEFNLRRLSKKP